MIEKATPCLGTLLLLVSEAISYKMQQEIFSLFPYLKKEITSIYSLVGWWGMKIQAKTSLLLNMIHIPMYEKVVKLNPFGVVFQHQTNVSIPIGHEPNHSYLYTFKEIEQAFIEPIRSPGDLL